MKAVMLVAVSLCLVIPTPQARAVDFETISTAAQIGYMVYERYLSGALTLEQAMDQILAEIASSRDAILNHMDNLAAIEARTCAKASVSDFENIEALESVAVLVARDMHECIVRLHATIAAVQDQAIADELGFALHALAPMALHTHAFAGLSSSQLVAELREAEFTIDRAVEPACSSWRTCEGTQHCECFWACTAYNGDRGTDDGMCGAGGGDRAVAVKEALTRTSAAIVSGL